MLFSVCSLQCHQETEKKLGALSTDTTGELDVLGHDLPSFEKLNKAASKAMVENSFVDDEFTESEDSDTLGVNSTQVRNDSKLSNL